MGIFSSIAAGAASALGGAVSSGQAKSSAQKQNKYNVWLQENNQAFQREMAQNAHQYEIEDLKKAGLNPILSANGTSAGSIAGANSAQSTNPGNAPDFFSNAIDKAINMMGTQSAMDLQQKQGELAKAQAENMGTQSLVNIAKSKIIEPEAKAKIKHLASAAAMNKAEAEYKETMSDLAKSGISGKVFGSNDETKKMLTNAALIGTTLIPGIGIAKKIGSAGKAYRDWKAGRGFSKFIDSISKR